MKIQFKRIITNKAEIEVFDGDEKITVKKEDFDNKKTSEGAIPLNKWCSNLEDLKIDGLPIDFDVYQQKTVERSKHIGIQPMGIEELKVYPFDNSKLYKLHLNAEELNYAGELSNGEAKDLTKIIREHNNIVEIIIDAGSLSILPAKAFKDCSIISIKLPNTITSIGESCFSGCEKLKNINIPSNLITLEKGLFRGCRSLSNIKLPSNLQNINDEVFKDCLSLTSLFIPETVDSIGLGAFENCSLLSQINIPKDLLTLNARVFLNCRNIPKAEIPSRLISIKESSFEKGVNLTKLDLPSSISEIGTNAFKDTSIRFINFNKTMSEWYEIVPSSEDKGLDAKKLIVECTDGTIKFNLSEIEARNFSELQNYNFLSNVNYRVHLNSENFTHSSSSDMDLSNLIKSKPNIKEIAVDTGVSSITDNAFNGCSNLDKVTLEKDVTSIGNNAFADCSLIKTLNLPSNMTTIGDNAFIRCVKINNFDMPHTVTSLGAGAFEDCSELVKISLSGNLNKLNSNTFKNCTKLEEIFIPNSIGTVDTNAFENCTSLRKVNIQAGVREIKDSAFINCSSLAEINIPELMELVGNDVFRNCTSLTNINISDSVTSLGTNSFNNCTGLTNITLGNGITTVKANSFEGCSSLNSVTLGNLTSIIEDNSFKNCGALGTIDLGTNMTSLGATSFENCSGLTEIGIPLTVSNIGKNAFIGTNIKVVNTPKTIAEWYSLVPDETEIGLSGITVNGKDGSVSPDLTELKAMPFDELKTYNFVPTVNYKLHVNYENMTHQDELNNILRNKAIKKLEVDNSVEPISLEPTVFNNCSNLDFIKLGNSVSTISDTAFLGCTGLKDLVVDSTNENFSSAENIIYDKQKTKLFVCSIGNTGALSNIPESVTSIENNAFRDCSGITSITLPTSLSNIGIKSFENCTGISTINLPSTLSGIGQNAFNGVPLITVNYESPVADWYNLIPDMSVIGVNPIITEIICTDGNIKNGLTEVNARAFSELQVYNFIPSVTYKLHINSENMTHVDGIFSELPGFISKKSNIKEICVDPEITSIKAYTFVNCTNLTKVYIPIETTQILGNSFLECQSIGDIVYGGTMSQWNTMVPDLSDLGLVPEKVTVICTDGEISTQGILYTPEVMTLDEMKAYNFEADKKYRVQLNNELLNPVTPTPMMARTLSVEPTTVNSNEELKTFLNSKNNILQLNILDDVTSLSDSALSELVNIEKIEFNNILDSVGTGLFSGDTALKEIKNIKFLRGTKDASSMFADCSNLTSIDTSLFNKVNKTTNMFKGCSNLTSVDTSAFNNILNADNMFNGCSSLTNISWGEGLVPNKFDNMFANCTQTIAIEAKGWFSKQFVINNAEKMGLTYTINQDVFEKPEINNTTVTYTKYQLYDYDKAGTYNLTVDCSEINPVEFVGKTTLPYEVSPFGSKLSSAIEGVSFNLTPANIGTDVTSTECMFYGCENLTNIDVSAFNKTTKTSNMFSYCNNLTEVTGTNELNSVTDADYMFQYCEKLTNVDTSGFTNVSKANNMFSYCNGLTSIDVSGLTSVTDTSYMFYSCKNLTEVIGENVFNNVLNSNNMFDGCDKLTNVNTRTFTATKDTSYMFSGCSSLTNIDTSAFTNVENSGYMFQDCNNLTNINTEAFTAVAEAPHMFNRCNNLTSIDTSGFANVQNASYMFQGCNKLNEITGTSQLAKVTNASYMFAECNSLTNIDTSAFNKVTDSSYMFSGCNTLTELNIDAFTATKNTRRMFSDCSNLISINADNLGEITDASYMFNNCSSLIDITWGDNFRPTVFESMFKGATANKEILASAESIEFIKTNELAMELANYKTTDREELIINTIYTGLSEMYNPVISVPSFTFNGVTCKNVDFVFMGIAENEGNLGKAIYMSTDCLPGVKASMDSLLAGGDSLGTGTIGIAAATSLDSAIFAITNKHLQEYTRTYDGHISSEKVFLPLECEVQGVSTNSSDAELVNKYPQWASFKGSPDSKIKYIDYGSSKYAVSNWLNANTSKENGNVCGVGANGESINIVSSSAENGIVIAFCL